MNKCPWVLECIHHSALAVLSIWTHLWNSGVVTISTLWSRNSSKMVGWGMLAFEPSLTISEGNCFNDFCTLFKWNKECLRFGRWPVNFDSSNITMLTTSLKLLPGPQPQHLTVTGWLWWLLWLRTLISSTIIQKLVSLATQWDVFTLFGSSTRNHRYLQYPTIQKR